MKNPHTIWASVVIVFLLVTGSVVLVIKDKDVTVIMTLAAIVAVPVLGAFGAAIYQKMDQVKEGSNGNFTKVLDMQQETQRQLTELALRLNPQPQLPSLETEDTQGAVNEGLRNPS